MTSLTGTVNRVIEQVRKHGDHALCDFAWRFDKVCLKPAQLLVSAEELKRAQKRVSASFLKAIRECAHQIEGFALAERKRLPRSWFERQGSMGRGQLIRPVDSVGIYVPGGRFPYPSTVLMTVIPAKVAGVLRIVVATPPKNLTPEVMAAAHLAGCQAVYRAGGASAIAALAYGTPRIPKVDFIVGPGNQYVTEAKRMVYGQVGIDSLAGPSEVVILADRQTPVSFIVNDLQAQAEHDPEASALLLSTDRALLREARQHLDRLVGGRVRFKFVHSWEEATEEVNAIGPEHLELLIRNPQRVLSKIRHAGAIFLGPSSPAAMGDYVGGPSHVLPTNGAARFSSGLSVATFLKRSSVMGFQARPGERNSWEAALTMAQSEGMEYHEKSLQCRISR